MTRPLTAYIDLAAMRHNLSAVRSAVPDKKIWAVVKANGYGHGLERSVRAFADTDGLAMIELESAVRIRESGWTKPILLLEGFFHPRELPDIAEHGISFAVHRKDQIELLEKTAFSKQIDVHLKMNSGMNRLGFKPEEFRIMADRLSKIPAVRKITYMMHFANSETAGHPVLPVEEQLRRFDEATAGMKGERNLSNSGAILCHPEIRTDWVRPGIMLYGGTPGTKSAKDFGLIPAMNLKSEIIGIQHIEKGDAIGYGSIFTARKPMKIGVVACGYADGYPRVAPEGTPVMVEGVRTGLVGRVSMDMITVDLTHIPQSHVGSPVELWGPNLPIEEVANAAGTVGYELMCALSMRPRIVEVDNS